MVSTIHSATDFTVDPYRVTVPQHAPLNTVHLEECTSYWPMKILGQTLLNPMDITQQLTASQLHRLTEQMNYALEIAARQSKAGHTPIVALLLSPSTLEVVAEGLDTTHEYPWGHATMNCIQQRSQTMGDHEYVCSDLWLLLTREPCAMCAMAAVHSRVGTVIYSMPSPEVGALGSRYQLHLQPSLNHHYRVFRHLALPRATTIWSEYTNTLHKRST